MNMICYVRQKFCTCFLFIFFLCVGVVTSRRGRNFLLLIHVEKEVKEFRVKKCISLIFVPTPHTDMQIHICINQHTNSPD